MRRVYLLSAWKSSGKDEMAQRLVKNHGFVQMSYAQALKDQVAERYGIPREDCDRQDRKELPIESMPVDFSNSVVLRHMDILAENFRGKSGEKMPGFMGPLWAQRLYGRLISKLFGRKYYWTPRALCVLEGQIARGVIEDIWVLNVAKAIAKSDSDVVISDCRFPNEIHLMKKILGNRVVAIRVNRYEKSSVQNHTETALDEFKFDLVIENKGTLKEYHKKIDELLAA